MSRVYEDLVYTFEHISDGGGIRKDLQKVLRRGSAGLHRDWSRWVEGDESRCKCQTSW